MSSPGYSRYSGPLDKFRAIVWQGKIPIRVSLDETELPPGSDKSIESFYLEAPRISYLTLILSHVQKHLVDFVLDESSAVSQSTETMWFEWKGIPLRWHWPIGLLYDYHTTHTNEPLPFHIKLHLTSPPLDRLFNSPSVDISRSNFMNMIKEADFVRWGNTRKVTALKRADQDALWESVVEHDLDKYWSIASKLIPLIQASGTSLSSSTASLSTSSLSQSSSPSENNNNNSNKMPDLRAIKSIPMRVYLPEVPVLQDLTPPINEESNRPSTLNDTLSIMLPALFPPRSTNLSASMISTKPLAKAIVQGVEIPLDTELGWLSATLCGADGWLAVVIKLL